MMSTAILLLAVFSPLADDDVKAFQGKWTFISIQVNGQMAPAAALEGIMLVVEGETYKQTQGGVVVEEGKTKFSPDKTPKEVEMSFTQGPQKGKTQLGIYKFDGDTATFCFTETGTKTRPKDFTAAAGSKQELFVMKKAK